LQELKRQRAIEEAIQQEEDRLHAMLVDEVHKLEKTHKEQKKRLE